MDAVEDRSPAGWIDRPACPACDARSRRVVLDLDSIPIVACTACGMTFSGRIMDPARLAAYYADGFGSDRHREGQRINARVNLRAVERLLGSVRLRTALDIGSGYGYFVRALRARGVEARGLEPSSREADEAIEGGIPTAREALGPDSGGRFDLVTAFEVIEHTAEPRRFLADAARRVAPGGWLVVMTDNFEARVVERMGAAFPKWIPHAHVSHFAPATFERLCGALPGLRIEGRLSYTPWELSLLMLRHRLVERGRKYELRSVMATEMRTAFRWPVLRRALDPVWFRISARPRLEGQLMYIALHRHQDA